MNETIPTNPAKFFELAVCSICKHKACLSLPTEIMTSHGVYRFELSSSESSSDCPFYSVDTEQIKSFLASIGIKRLNQIYRYLLNEYALNGETPVASMSVMGLEGKGGFIISLIMELVSSGKIRVFGVPEKISPDIRVQWWMRAHQILAKPRIIAN